MGERNVMTTEYVRENDKFADLCNYVLYQGKDVVKATDLTEKDVTELALPYNMEGTLAVEKVRDILKNCCVKTANGVVYLIIGVENQADIHYAMVVRNMLYDALNYSSQVSAHAKEHKKKRDITGDEFLSGFAKEDKLVPVITLTIYWNSGTWDGARSLHEMLDVKDEELLKYISDYKLNLIVPDEITDFEKFRTELGKVLQYFSCASSGSKMKALIEEKRKEGFRLSKEAIRLINACFKQKLPEPKKEGDDEDMCKALEELIAEGEARGEAKGALDTLLELVRNGALDVAVGAEYAKMKQEEFVKLI